MVAGAGQLSSSPPGLPCPLALVCVAVLGCFSLVPCGQGAMANQSLLPKGTVHCGWPLGPCPMGGSGALEFLPPSVGHAPRM